MLLVHDIRDHRLAGRPIQGAAKASEAEADEAEHRHGDPWGSGNGEDGVTQRLS
ncbi:hypothetical protein D3C85_1094220 [compost metagenome]